jgi:hypothetical protein
MPALTALTSDRLVEGSSAALSEFLDAAAVALSNGSSTDPQILVFGSGEAADAEAVAAACDNLATSGVRVSALGIDPDEEGAALLSGCASATDAYYETVEGNLGEACQRALTSVLVVELTLSPETAELTVGDEHTVTASMFGGDDPENGLVGVTVTFGVTAGPNAGTAGTADTDESGAASFSYFGEGGPGIDTLVATAAQPRTGSALADTVMVSWDDTLSCDPGGPYAVDVDADTASVMLDASASTGPSDYELVFAWSASCESVEFDDAASATPTVSIFGDCLCEDEIEVMLTVSAGEETSECSAVITINDLRNPTLIAGEPYMLWPPNHKYQTFGPEMLLEVEGTGCPTDFSLDDVMIVEVSSNEPEDANGDGRTDEDIVLLCPNQVDLRAERMGGGQGRVYTITYRATFADGSTQDVDAYVVVPHDQGSWDGMPDPEGGYVESGCVPPPGDDDPGDGGGDF